MIVSPCGRAEKAIGGGCDIVLLQFTRPRSAMDRRAWWNRKPRDKGLRPGSWSLYIRRKNDKCRSEPALYITDAGYSFSNIEKDCCAAVAGRPREGRPALCMARGYVNSISVHRRDRVDTQPRWETLRIPQCNELILRGASWISEYATIARETVHRKEYAALRTSVCVCDTMSASNNNAGNYTWSHENARIRRSHTASIRARSRSRGLVYASAVEDKAIGSRAVSIVPIVHTCRLDCPDYIEKQGQTRPGSVDVAAWERRSLTTSEPDGRQQWDHEDRLKKDLRTH